MGLTNDAGGRKNKEAIRNEGILPHRKNDNAQGKNSRQKRDPMIRQPNRSVSVRLVGIASVTK